MLNFGALRAAAGMLACGLIIAGYGEVARPQHRAASDPVQDVGRGSHLQHGASDVVEASDRSSLFACCDSTQVAVADSNSSTVEAVASAVDVANAAQPLPLQPLQNAAQKNVPMTDSAGGVSIIEARFGAYNGWVDVTEQLRGHLKQGRVQLPSLKPFLENVKDPAFGHHKALVVVYRQFDIVRMKIVPSDGVEGGWGSLTLPEPLQLLVAGNKSDNIVRFDLTTGESTVLARLASGSQPWSIALHPSGEIYVGLRGNKKNIVRLVPGTTGAGDASLVAVDLTETIGRYGPGLMAFDRRGLLNVAADTLREVQRYDVKTGGVVESMRLRQANIVGLMQSGDSVYAAEYFQKTIVRFDLTADPPRGETFIDNSEHLDQPHGMTIGHNGNLFVSNLKNSLVQEFSSQTHQFVKTFADVRILGGDHVKDLHFEPRLNHYLLTSGDAVYELSTDGALVAKHHSDALSGAVGIAVGLVQ